MVRIVRVWLLGAGLLASSTGCLPTWVGLKSEQSPAPAAPTEGGSKVRSTATLSTDESASLSFTMAESLEASGRVPEAASYYEKARQTDPAYADRASRRLAVLYDKMDEQTKAMTEFQALLAKNPDDSALLGDVGYSYYNRGQWAEAERYLKKATAIDSTNKRAWNNLGLTFGQEGKYEDALSAFAMASSPAQAYSNLGFVYLTQQKMKEAKESYQKAIELDSTLQTAHQMLAKLEAPQDEKGGNQAVSHEE